MIGKHQNNLGPLLGFSCNCRYYSTTYQFSVSLEMWGAWQGQPLTSGGPFPPPFFSLSPCHLVNSLQIQSQKGTHISAACMVIRTKMFRRQKQREDFLESDAFPHTAASVSHSSKRFLVRDILLLPHGKLWQSFSTDRESAHRILQGHYNRLPPKAASPR